MYRRGLGPFTYIITCVCICMQQPRDIKLYCPQPPNPQRRHQRPGYHTVRVTDLSEIFTFRLSGDAQKRLMLLFQSWDGHWSWDGHQGLSDLSNASLTPVSPVDISWNIWRAGPDIQRRRPHPGPEASLGLGKSTAAASRRGDREPSREDALAAQVCL